MKKKSLLIYAITMFVITVFTAKGQNLAGAGSWKLIGNNGTNASTNFLGTIDYKPLVFKTNNLERMRMTKEGKVGIGTTAPRALLNIIDPNVFTTLSLPGLLVLGDSASSNMSLDHNVIQARYNATAAPIYLNYYGGTTYLGPSAGVGVFSGGILTTSGNVGIKGSYNSSYALNVNANSSLNGINVTDGVNAYALNATKSGSFAGIYSVKTGASTLDACVWGNATGSARGLEGSSTNGDGVYGYTANSAAYAGYFIGNVYCTGSYLPSDLKLKHDVQDFSKATDILNQLHPKIYEYNADNNFKLMNLPKGLHYGLIAEEVEKILPNLVKQSKFQPGHDADVNKPAAIDFKAVNYTELIPIMIKGMQEHQATIDRQELLINKQQQQIEQLTKMVNTLAGNTDKSSFNTNKARLEQNTPNPFTQNTVIRCYVPSTVSKAQLVVYSSTGRQVKSFVLDNKGSNQVTISAGSLSSGKYSYVLIADGENVDSRDMILTK